ncbi:MAG: amidohydrolase family protein, partial [Deltaproteobacteria bacterium]|nr:amidohydrolase family protein [Deltaproteobacteria bacterium]
MSKTVILTKAAIIDGTGAEPMPGSAVVIEEDRIKEVLPSSPKQTPPGAEIIDCQGQTLLPGLIDAHVHVGAIEANIGEQHRLHLPSYTLVRTLKMMALALDQGFTTVRDAGGADAGLRQAVAEGLAVGPRLLVSGSPLTQTGGHCDFRLPAETFLPDRPPFGLGGIICDGVTEVRQAAREQLRQGVDQIKVMAGGGC